MKPALLLIALLSASAALAAPENAPRPGGVAIVDIGDAEGAMPEASWNDKPVLVMQEGGRWKAVVGIPLDTKPGALSVTVAGEARTVPVTAHSYAEQRLTVKNQSYVTPDQAQLDRIARERGIIDEALNRFRAVPVTGIALDAPVDGPRSSSFARRTRAWTSPRAAARRSGRRAPAS